MFVVASAFSTRNDPCVEDVLASVERHYEGFRFGLQHVKLSADVRQPTEPRVQNFEHKAE